MAPSIAPALRIAAGLAGACGVVLSAVAAHRVNDPALATAAPLLVMQAAAALGALARVVDGERRPGSAAWVLAAGLLLAGAALFSGDIAMRAFAGHRLFPFAAPMGGSTMIAGWLMVAVAAALELRSGKK